MVETKKLYDENAYATEFSAKVLSCEEMSKGVYLYLDQTLFFPEEGGQYPDKGVIDGYEVHDVQIKKGVIRHTLEGNISELIEHFTAGREIFGKIEFDRRYDFMQQHSGEHVLTGLIFNEYGYANVGFHLSEEIVTMDVDGPLTKEQLNELEQKANVIVRSNRTITTGYPDKETLNATQYRSKIEIDGAVRLVTIEDHDICACCAPHVRTTGEIGQIHIVKAENYKGGMRLEIKCGNRALLQAQDYRKLVGELSVLLSANAEKMTEAVMRLQQELTAWKAKAGALESEKLNRLLEEIHEEGDHLFFMEEVDPNAVRNLVNQMMEKSTGISACFIKVEEGAYRYIVGSKQIDVTGIQAIFKEKGNAKGGGNAKMIQGTVYADEQQIRNFMVR